MSATLSEINTTLFGTAGDSGTQPSENGGDAPTGGSTEAFDNQDFAPLAASGLYLDPDVVGGAGGNATSGAGGKNSTSSDTQTTSGNTTTETINYTAAQGGDPGGTGGASAPAQLTLDDDTVGTPTSIYDSYFTLSLNTVGADGGFSGGGGGGGNGGSSENESETSGGNTFVTYSAGAAGVSGNSGGAGGAGGSAISDLTDFGSDASEGTTVALAANAGAGAQGGQGGNGGAGSVGGGGGDGAQGGAGGNATTAITGSTLVDQSFMEVELSSTAGEGGIGGDGGAGGIGHDISNAGTSTTYAVNGGGANGGDSGAAESTLTGDSFTAPSIILDLTAVGTAGGAAGSGGSNGVDGAAPGIDGAAGANGTELITFTDNVVNVSAGLSKLSLEMEVNGVISGTTTGTVPLDGAAGGNLVFAGNQFVGTGTSTLDLFLAGGGATVDTAADTLSIGGSSGNSMTGFTNFDLDVNDTFVAGTGTYDVRLHSDPDTVVYGPDSGTVTLEGIGSTTSFVLDFRGFGASLDPQILAADTTITGGSTFIDVTGHSSIELLGYTSAIPSGDVAFTPACFLAGTRIATPAGGTPIEALCPGDLVRLADGRALPVRWVGRQTISRRFADPVRVLPVRIRAGALGGGLPQRDLLVSPGHAMLLEKVLVHAGALVGLPGIARDTAVPEIFAYYHVELDEHAILLAEGAAAESFRDGAEPFGFDNRNERPDMASPPELDLPRVKAARQLPASLRRRAA